MLNVSQAVKNAYANPSSAKNLMVYFPELDITVDPNTVYSETFSLSEAIMDSTSIEFVGCNPSKMKVQIQDFGENVKGKKIYVYIYTDDTENEPVPLFTGIVDSVTQQSNKRIKEITAYDVLYFLGNKDIAQWYIAKFSSDWEHGTNLKTFRDALFTYLGLDVVEATLVNDDIEFVKEYSPVNMKALDVIKYICQINGVFGIVNRENKFEFRSIQPISSSTPIAISSYKEIDYQEFTVKPVDKLIIRQSEQEEGVSSGQGTNTYIIQGNFFTLHLEEEALQDIADALYPMISGISYIPYKITQIGYPWLECGDIVQYEVYDFEASARTNTDTYRTMSFYIFDRYLKGIQAFRDEYEAQGEEEQSVFITNINAQIDTIKDQIEQISGKLNALGLKYVMFYNERAIDIADGHRQAIASNEFAVAQASQVHIEMEYLLECTTTESEDSTYITDNDLQVTMLYEFDGVFIDSRQPKETYQDGKHILHTYYVINVPDAQPHSWRVFLECSGGSVHIDQLQAQNTILGLGTLVGDLWDGTIKAEEIIEPITFNRFIGEFIDSVSVTPQTPTPATANEVIPVLTFGSFLGGFTDSVEFDSNYLNFYPYDGVTTSTCTIENYKWKGAGDVTLPELTLTSNASIIADSDEGITFLISDDSGTTWYGWNGVSWVENYNMSLTQFNDLTEYKGLSVIVKATLLANNYLTNIKVYGGTI